MLLDESPTACTWPQTGLIGGDFPNHKTRDDASAASAQLKDGQDELAVRFESPGKAA